MSDRITVGNVEILAFVDIGPAPRDPAMVFPDVPADAWGAYKDTMTPDGLLPFQMGFFALRFRRPDNARRYRTRARPA